MGDEVWRTMAWHSLSDGWISGSPSGSGLLYCEKATFGHFERCLSSNSQLYRQIASYSPQTSAQTVANSRSLVTGT